MTGFSQVGQFLHQSGLGRWGLAVTLLLALLAVGAPWLAPYDPAAQNLPERLVPPSGGHWLGTDELGRDILSRIFYCARVSMLVGASVVLGSAPPAGEDRGEHWHGERRPRGLSAQLPGARAAHAGAELGSDAQRRPQSSVRRAPSGCISRAGCHGCGSGLQPTGRRVPRLARPAHSRLPGHT